jgi:protoporphyrinogen oxidase
MVRPNTACLGVEYFCDDEDDIWMMSDTEAVDLAKREMASIGLIDPDLVTNGVKVQVPLAYPVYDAGYREAVAEIRGYLESFENLQTCGRNGLHRYNNQDHSMWTAALATMNLVDGGDRDVWSINSEGEYLEQPDEIEGELEGLETMG